MAKKKELLTTVDFAIQGIQKKKGKQIVKLDLRKTSNSVTNYFVICQGNSKPQMNKNLHR